MSDDFGKEGENGLFDAGEKDGFGGVFDTKKRKNVKSRPDYRRVSRYYKSTKKYWAERGRRKQVLELSGQGLASREIAGRLGVSERTVKRDMDRIKPYYERLGTQLFEQVGGEPSESGGVTGRKNTSWKVQNFGKVAETARVPSPKSDNNNKYR